MSTWVSIVAFSQIVENALDTIPAPAFQVPVGVYTDGTLAFTYMSTDGGMSTAYWGGGDVTGDLTYYKAFTTVNDGVPHTVTDPLSPRDGYVVDYPGTPADALADVNQRAALAGQGGLTCYPMYWGIQTFGGPTFTLTQMTLTLHGTFSTLFNPCGGGFSGATPIVLVRQNATVSVERNNLYLHVRFPMGYLPGVSLYSYVGAPVLDTFNDVRVMGWGNGSVVNGFLVITDPATGLELASGSAAVTGAEVWLLEEGTQ